MPFRPSPGETLTIDGLTYQAAEHPAAPGMAYGQEGRQGIVFQLLDPDDRPVALKLFKARFRAPALVTQANQIAPYAAIAGLEVCARRVLSPIRYGEVVRQHPDLSYAVLMPWVSGPTWLDIILDRGVLTPAESLAFARSLALLLTTMEERRIAHCDLSAPNVLLPGLLDPPGQPLVALVDVEQFYGPGLDKPDALPGGSAGYAHRTAPAGLWSAQADRFAGAVLLAEMLGWCDPQVRAASSEESYFDPEEIQQPNQRYDRLCHQLAQQWGADVAQLFQQAWESDDFADCPPFGEWLVALPNIVPSPRLASDPVATAAITPSDNQTAVTQFLTFAAELRTQGNREGALVAYRGALSLLPAHSGPAEEIRLLISDVEAAPDTSAAPPAFKPAAPAPPSTPVTAVPALTREQQAQLSLDRPRARPTRWPWWLGGGAVVIAIVVLLVSILSGEGSELAPVTIPAAPAAVPAASTIVPAAPALIPISQAATDGSIVEIERLGKGRITTIAMAPDGSALAVGTSVGVYLYNPETLIDQRFIPYNRAVLSVAFAPDGATLASASDDGTVRLWQVADGALLQTLEGHNSVVNSVAFAPGGATIASASWDNTVRLWQVADGALLQTLEGHNSGVNSVAFAPDGATLASASDDGTVRLWQVADGALLQTLEGHSQRVNSVAFAPDGASLASASGDRTVRLWRVADGKLLQTLEGYSDGVNSVAFAPDGASFAAASDDGTMHLWRVDNGALLQTMAGHTNGVNSVAFAPDGATIASTSLDSTVRLWQVADGALLQTMAGHTSGVNSVAFAPDGATIASASYDDTVRLWRVADGALLQTLEGHSYAVLSVAFAPDGATLASASDDGTVRLWRAR